MRSGGPGKAKKTTFQPSNLPIRFPTRGSTPGNWKVGRLEGLPGEGPKMDLPTSHVAKSSEKSKLEGWKVGRSGFRVSGSHAAHSHSGVEGGERGRATHKHRPSLNCCLWFNKNEKKKRRRGGGGELHVSPPAQGADVQLASVSRWGAPGTRKATFQPSNLPTCTFAFKTWSNRLEGPFWAFPG